MTTATASRIQTGVPVQLECVLREIAPGDTQYVPTTDVAYLYFGETVFSGTFVAQLENHGPSGSHRRYVCTPRGALSKRIVPRS